MLRTLFSRMLAAYLSVIIIVLIALGFMASSIFHDHYIEKIKSELVREADAICRIVLEEYMDDAKRPVAKEKLLPPAYRVPGGRVMISPVPMVMRSLQLKYPEGAV